MTNNKAPIEDIIEMCCTIAQELDYENFVPLVATMITVHTKENNIKCVDVLEPLIRIGMINDLKQMDDAEVGKILKHILNGDSDD